MEIVFLFYQGMTALDAIGPHEIFCRLPDVVIKRAAIKAGLIQTESFHLTLKAEYSLHEIAQADLLLIPGSGKALTLRNEPEILQWICDIHKTTKWTTSVCTGSLILGAAGLLKNIEATSHWATIDHLSFFGAIPKKSRFVEDGKIITAAGVSAGIDMALYLVAKLYSPNLAQTLQLGIEYDPEPPFDAGSPDKAPPSILDALRTRLDAQFEKI